VRQRTRHIACVVICLETVLKVTKYGHDAFVTEGFVNWKKGPERFGKHVGDRDSFHNMSLKNVKIY
jgi:hypothetical protein